MSMPLKLRSGFSFDEAILMAKFSKRSYEIFQVGGGSVRDAEVQNIYNSLYKDEKWRLVHSLQSDAKNIRGFILHREQTNQYIVIFRGSIFTDHGQVELTDILTDLNWSLVNYGSLPDTRIKVAEGFFQGFEAVKDELAAFFKVLLGQITTKDFDAFQTHPLVKQVAIASAIAAAGGVRFSLGFARRLERLIADAISYDVIANLDTAWDFARSELLSFENLSKELDELDAQSNPVNPEIDSKVFNPSDRLEVYVAGHSLGGALANLCALSLKRRFGSSEECALRVKVYTFGAVKVGNQNFVEYYNEQLGEGYSYRVENQLDLIPLFPLTLPFPLSLVAANGFRLGEIYLGNYEHVGESHSLIGLGNHRVLVDLGGAAAFMGGIPFPHSFDAYIQLLEADKQRWQQLWQPIRGVLNVFLQEILEEQEADIVASTQAQMQQVQTQLAEEIQEVARVLDEIKSELRLARLNVPNE
jgi:Lipase (class 3)